MILSRTKSVAFVLTLLVPLGLLHAWAYAEVGIALVDILFIVETVRSRNVSWCRQPWFVAAIIWWAWLVFCSTPWPGFSTAGWQLSFIQAVVIIRLVVFVAALQNWVLTTPEARRAAWLALALSALWIGLESWQQYLTGTNLFGDHRWGDGSLTGPFHRPRAGALYGHLAFVALLPAVMALYAKRGASWRVAGMGLLVIGVVTSVLIGQRMGTAFTILGAIAAALFIAPLRPATAIALAAAMLLLLATPFISPPTHAKLVVETSRNMHHFTQSPYGELYTRAATMGLASPWHGWGYNGFRAFCPEDRFATGFPALGIVPTQLARGACNLHPHNFYMQAFADAGFPGLILFIVMNLAWLAALLRGLWRRPDPVRTGLFIGVLTYAWPLASTDAFPTLYEPGWLFFMLGLGLALAHISPSSQILDSQHA